jgi:hypothetical protein
VSAGGDDPLEPIRRDFPAWHAWLSSTGRYWATRIGRRKKPDDLSFDASVAWAMTVGDYATGEQLREALAEQDGHAPPELAGAVTDIKTDPDG